MDSEQEESRDVHRALIPWDPGVVVEWFLQLECWNGRTQALQGGEEGEMRRGCHPHMSMTSWSAWSSALGWMRSPLRAHRSGLKAVKALATLQWGSATGHPTRKTEQTRPL